MGKKYTLEYENSPLGGILDRQLFLATAEWKNKLATIKDVEIIVAGNGDPGPGPDSTDYVPTTRTVNNKALSNDITLSATDVGLGNVTNESKTTMFTSPTFTGTPLSVTATKGTNTTQIATTKFVQTAIGDYVPTTRTVNNQALSSDIILSLDHILDGSTRKLSDYVAKNAAITGATKIKITYDSKGLVTAGADATLDDIPDGLTRKLTNYVPTTRKVNGKALSSDIILSLDHILDGSTRKWANKADIDGYYPLMGAGTSDKLATPITIGGVSFDGSANINLPGVNTAGSQNTSGNAATATKLETARTIGLGTGVTSTATSFNGLSDITIPVTGVSEAYLTWGGKNLSGIYGPIDAAMVNELGANRFAFYPENKILVEYSLDAGVTWLDYEATPTEKINLFNGIGTTLRIGKNSSTGVDYTNYRLRVTLNNTLGSLYTTLNKFVMLISTNGSGGVWTTIEGRLQSNIEASADTWEIFSNQTPIDGWSGYNVINIANLTTYGNSNSKSSQYGEVRFTFGGTTANTSYSGLQVSKILGFGGVGWSTPSNLAKYGNLYTYNYLQEATFPAKITAPTFAGTLTGNAATATKLATARTLTIGAAGKTFNGGADVTWSLADIGLVTTFGSTPTDTSFPSTKLVYDTVTELDNRSIDLLSVNGNTLTLKTKDATTYSVALPNSLSTYAPTTSGSSGQLLISTGISNPIWTPALTLNNGEFQIMGRAGEMKFDGTIFNVISDYELFYLAPDYLATITFGALTDFIDIGGVSASPAVNTRVNFLGTTEATSSDASASFAGGVKISKKLRVVGDITTSGNISAANFNKSTSSISSYGGTGHEYTFTMTTNKVYKFGDVVMIDLDVDIKQNVQFPPINSGAYLRIASGYRPNSVMTRVAAIWDGTSYETTIGVDGKIGFPATYNQTKNFRLYITYIR